MGGLASGSSSENNMLLSETRIHWAELLQETVWDLFTLVWFWAEQKGSEHIRKSQCGCAEKCCLEFHKEWHAAGAMRSTEEAKTFEVTEVTYILGWKPESVQHVASCSA